jgi:hypothetical protein
VHDETARAIRLQRPVDPADEEDRRHCERHVQIGADATEDRLIM